jgi:2-succinyl-6-hydroxy-2,4-cyclohexadiene-1-carboxylate synthase
MTPPSPLHHVLTGPSDAPPVLFLHGFLGCGGDWADTVAGLEAEYRCLVVDLPGHGRSPAGDAPEDYSMPRTAERLVELMRKLEARPWSVVGYSMGGRLALYLALARPEMVRQAVLESASPGLADAGDRATRRAADERWARTLESEPMDVFLRRWYAQEVFGSLRDRPDRLERLIVARRRNDPAGLARSLRGMGLGSQPSCWERLPECAAPVDLIVGEYDAKFRAVAAEMAARSPRCRVHIAAGCGHNVHFEDPDRYTRLLKGILSRRAP